MTRLGVPNPPLPNRKRPNNGVAFTTPSRSDYRSTCQICKCGVFTGDATVWGRGRHTGLLHEPCARQAGVTVVAQASGPLPAARPEPAEARPERRQTRGEVLTVRQVSIVRLLADGHTPAQIAAIENLTYQTVNNVTARARARIGAADNAALIEAARRYGLISTTKGS